MVTRFLVVWIVYWLTIALLPVSSIYPATTAAFLLQFSFVLLVAVALTVVVAESGVRRLQPKAFDVSHSVVLIWTAIVLSIIGLVALTYDKIWIQGIDFSQGLAAARVQWAELGAAREGKPSSIFSILGYLLGSSYYVGTVLAITQTRTVSSRHRTAALAASLLLVLANSALTGGRSGVLLWGVFVVGALGAREKAGLQQIFPKTFRRPPIALLVAIAIGYVLYVFYQRADLTNAQPIHYALDFLPFLGLNASSWYVDWLDETSVGGVSAMLILAASYITHSFASVAAIIDAPSEKSTVLFVSAIDIMYKLGLSARPDGDWFLAGRLLSVPGALWHQFALSGFVVGSILLGTVCALAQVWYARHPTRLLPLGAYTSAEATLILTPAIFAPDLLYFPFALAGFAVLAVVDHLFRQVWFQSRVRPAQEGLVFSVRGKADNSV